MTSVTNCAGLNRILHLFVVPTGCGPTHATVGHGMKFAIIDDGLDRTHVFFDPTNFTYPAGFPKGNTAYTSAKVIVARSFAPANLTWKYPGLPFDPQYSDHATNVAGIAAGDHDTIAAPDTGNFKLPALPPAPHLAHSNSLSLTPH